MPRRSQIYQYGNKGSDNPWSVAGNDGTVSGGEMEGEGNQEFRAFLLTYLLSSVCVLPLWPRTPLRQPCLSASIASCVFIGPSCLGMFVTLYAAYTKSAMHVRISGSFNQRVCHQEALLAYNKVMVESQHRAGYRPYRFAEAIMFNTIFRMPTTPQ